MLTLNPEPNRIPVVVVYRFAPGLAKKICNCSNLTCVHGIGRHRQPYISLSIRCSKMKAVALLHGSLPFPYIIVPNRIQSYDIGSYRTPRDLELPIPHQCVLCGYPLSREYKVRPLNLANVHTNLRRGSASRRKEPESWQEVLKQLAGIGKAIDEANKRADKQQPRKRATNRTVGGLADPGQAAVHARG